MNWIFCWFPLNKKVEELSKGNQQKIQFISAVLHKPELLILDEPFSEALPHAPFGGLKKR
jgi:ABC-type uncharacterized transport system ATPase subunit